MKKYFYGLVIFLFIGITMQSCKDDQNAPVNETVATQNANKSASWNQVEQQLKALDMSYGLTKNIRRSPNVPGSLVQVTEYTNWDLNNMGSAWGIALADLGGFCGGVGAAGVYFGPTYLTLGIGVIVGAISSYLAYKASNGSQTVINPSNPFVYISQGNRFVENSEAPIGSEAGDLHNSLVKEMLQDENLTELTSTIDIYEYMCTMNLSCLNDYFTSQQISNIQEYMYQDRTDILGYQNDWTNYMELQGHADEMNIIKHYAYAVSQTTTPFDMEQYTSDFMQLVDGAYRNGLISEESALMINGSISTLYCSKTAWIYIQPDPYQTTRYILHGDNTWYIADGQEDAEAIMADDTTIDFVGYPYIGDGEVKRIYVYAGLSYNLSLPDFEDVMSILNSGVYINTVDAGTDGTNNYTLSLGSHLVLSATGYDDYVYIDFEQ